MPEKDNSMTILANESCLALCVARVIISWSLLFLDVFAESRALRLCSVCVCVVIVGQESIIQSSPGTRCVPSPDQQAAERLCHTVSPFSQSDLMAPRTHSHLPPYPPFWGLLLLASLCTDHMTGICYITPLGWLKIHSAPAKFIRDGPGHCVVTGCLAARTWQQTQTQQFVRHTPTVKDHSSPLLAYCAAIRR